MQAVHLKGMTNVMELFFHGPCLLFAATKDETKKTHYREKISSYMSRAENIKKYLEKEKEGMKFNVSFFNIVLENSVYRLH